MMMGSPESTHSFVLPGETDALEQSMLSMQSSLDVPALNHTDSSPKKVGSKFSSAFPLRPVVLAPLANLNQILTQICLINTIQLMKLPLSTTRNVQFQQKFQARVLQ